MIFFSVNRTCVAMAPVTHNDDILYDNIIYPYADYRDTVQTHTV